MSDPQRDSRVGTQIGPYRLQRLLGKGAMGGVYEAEDTVKDRIVALNLLPEAVSHGPVFGKRLQARYIRPADCWNRTSSRSTITARSTDCSSWTCG